MANVALVKQDKGILIENNRTSPMTDTEYEDKHLNLGFVFRSLGREQLGGDLILMN